MNPNYIYIAITVIATVFGQISVKIGSKTFNPPAPNSLKNFILYIWEMVTNPFIFAGLALAFLASMSWIFTLKKFDLSHAYPFMSLPLILVMLISGIFFKESIGFYKILGSIFVITGILFVAKGA